MTSKFNLCNLTSQIEILVTVRSMWWINSKVSNDILTSVFFCPMICLIQPQVNIKSTHVLPVSVNSACVLWTRVTPRVSHIFSLFIPSTAPLHKFCLPLTMILLACVSRFLPYWFRFSLLPSLLSFSIPLGVYATRFSDMFSSYFLLFFFSLCPWHRAFSVHAWPGLRVLPPRIQRSAIPTSSPANCSAAPASVAKAVCREDGEQQGEEGDDRAF